MKRYYEKGEWEVLRRKNTKEKKKMGTMIYKFKRILSVFVLAALFAELPGFTSQAAGISEREESIEVEVLEAKVLDDLEWNSGIVPRTMLVDCMINVGRKSDGMHIDVMVGTVGTASVLGVKDIKIWKKNSKGKWELVAVSDGGECYNSAIGGVTITYANAVVGATYKITCVHYGDVNGMEECDNDSGEFVYNFPISP